ncbi:hypothetical protein [Mesorhizobium sp. M7A.F.Ca.US.011.01.1.1]|uniref:hypothetical protein n=1 Tax=Mesorhizobium sp. M7A.F.Ca.US.011.01.1.1 TaxID=2496741 RepID=UPI0013E2D9AF|nr:hypothetical protein [Mesorhizobium sp. M7A.F.Ca.US.011.01.1.1]
MEKTPSEAVRFAAMITSTAAALQAAAMADLPGLSLEDLRGGNLAMAQQLLVQFAALLSAACIDRAGGEDRAR